MEWVKQAWTETADKLNKTIEKIGANFPDHSENGKYTLDDASNWTAGFWPGILWLVYSETGNEAFKDIAVKCEEKMDKVLMDFYPLHHDIGFMWSLTSVAHYKLLEDETAKRRALTAASHLAGRFNIKGGYLRAWPGDDDFIFGLSIIDSMMNLPILFWASEVTGDPRFKHIAMAHADMAAREFVRLDGSVHHMVVFDPHTGQRLRAQGGQGYSVDSAWSRGASWAIYGMAICYRYTKEMRYLESAKKIANYFISALPEDKAAYWDFRAPMDKDIPRDTSASAIASCGLIEISRLVSQSESNFYYNTAAEIIKSLYENYSALKDEKEEALILKATGNYPAGVNINVPYIFGDYYFVEALTMLRGNNKMFW